LLEVALRPLLKKSRQTHAVINEEQLARKKKRDARKSCINTIGFILCGSLCVVGVVLSNVFVSRNKVSATYQMMYTVAITFGWDFFFIQLLCGFLQALLISKCGLKTKSKIIKLLLNVDIAKASLSTNP